jgi:glyoxylase-like metal-dependent hydrolase (beta-lactamase superfamily II)
VQVVSVGGAVFGAWCHVLVDGEGRCVVLDAGAGVAGEVAELVAARALRPTAVLATHGHADHTWDAARLSEELDVPVVLHAADEYRLRDPFGTLGALGSAPHDPRGPLAQALVTVGRDPASYTPPSRVEPFGAVGDERTPDVELDLGGLRLVARHAPGHTEGSTLYLSELDDGTPLAFTGDVLFAGTIGRTDLPGGDGARMDRTLREVVSALDPRTVVVPGHGPTTTIERELLANPYLTAR